MGGRMVEPGSRGQLKTGARDWSMRHIHTGVTANLVTDMLYLVAEIKEREDNRNCQSGSPRGVPYTVPVMQRTSPRSPQH